MDKPVLLAVHDQPGDLRLIQQELTDRYARDHEIICTDSPASALHRLATLRGAPAAAVLILFAASEMRTMSGVEYLRRRMNCIRTRSASCSSRGATDRRPSRA